MNLSKLSVKRPVTITMIVLVVVLLGSISLTYLPIDLFPEIEVPVAVIATSYSGAGPQEVENLITKQIEGAVSTVGNIDEVDSMSSEGSSLVIALFNFGTDMDMATLEMREKVDMIKGFLPEDANDPMVMKIDPNSMPIIQVALSTNGDLGELQSLAEDTFSQRLERLEGVASVSIGGGFSKEIEVSVDESELANYGLSINQLSQLIGASNMNLPGGNVSKGDQKLAIRVTGEFNDIDEIKDMPIPLVTGDIIKLHDVAQVELVNKEVSSISRTNGRETINISIQKQSGKNTVQVADLINEEINALQEDYPDVKIDIVMDTAMFIKESINAVAENAIFGSLLAILILYIFLKNVRTTLIIGISIPISLISSFILLYVNGITLNMMTLGGLALAVGMLVDSSIVVLENIFRYRTEGHSKVDAAIEGASEVGLSIVASTLTTIAVFIPIVFIEGMVGTIFKDFALTVSLSLGASLLVSLTLIPMLSSKILTVDGEDGAVQKKKRLQKLYNVFDKILNMIQGTYEKLLNKSLNKRKTTIVIAACIFVASIVSIFAVGMEFLPATDEGTISINVGLPLGSEIEKVEQVVKVVEDKISTIEELDIIFSNIGAGDIMMGGSSSTNGASIYVTLIKLSERDRSTAQVAEEIRGLMKDIPGAEISVTETSSMSMTAGSPISISIRGAELDVLEDISNDFKGIIESVQGTREVKTSLSEAVPELEVLIKKDIAATYGLTSAQVASAVRAGASGVIATRYKVQGEEIDVVLRATGEATDSIANFEQMEINTPSGINIPLSQLAELSIIKGPTVINRQSQERVVSVSSQIVDRDLGSIMVDIEKKLEEYNMPKGYTFSIGGENQEMVEAFTQLALALLLAIVLIYMVMAAQFESLIYPFIIMFTIPLAFSGGALALFLTGRALGVTALIGVIILSGIVVNNGIILIDYINILRKEGKERTEAINIAGPIRLRPILMTTLTTILGLVPMTLGIGEGAELMAPMGTVVIGGLLLSTVLTLVLVPVLYTVFDDISNSAKARVRKIKDKVVN
ncbi:efflux RND transporter permease subunit [Tissierella sp. Yu-01]|uniref:efflux RND transporter permease subunit n=1 Tax=Tissierella sp. Yu-01 TaxID=3035694 RepID=UPI00240DB9CE|nr:efflux RND transporter permease subunit [Tissierella sp. Yu-01]WFA08549.1 efflux RND transporter permease subunit [Tissierella sp. Yu-01]